MRIQEAYYVIRAIPPAYISLMFIVLLLGLCLSNAPVFGDPDTAWHMAAGDQIRSQHAIPQTDSWSFTADSERWYNLSWLFDMAMSKLFAVGGFTALYVLTVLIFTCSLIFMAHLSIKRGASLLAVFLVTFFALLILYGGVSMRPTMCSIVLALAFYYFLGRYRDTGKPCYMCVLPGLMAFWVNLHGGFLIAYVIMASFVIEALWQRDRNRLRQYGIIIALCMSVSLINPYGFAIYYGAWRTLHSSIAPNVSEWQPVAIGHNVPITFLFLLFLVTFNATDKRIPLADRILSVAMLLLSLMSIRYSLFACLLLIPTLSLRLSIILLESKYAARWQKWDDGVMLDMYKTDIRIGMACMAIALLAFISIPSSVHNRLMESATGFPRKKNPVLEAEFIEQNYPSLRFMTDYNLGGYLDYLWRGRVKVFVDGRANSLYSDDLLQDYTEFMGNSGFGGRATAIVSQYHLEGMLIGNQDKNATLWEWNPYWKSVYHGEVATVFVRTDLAKTRKARWN